MKTTLLATALLTSSFLGTPANPAEFPGPVCITNLICTRATNQSRTVTLGIAGGMIGVTNHLYRATNLSGAFASAAWQWLQSITNCDPVTLSNQPPGRAFYVVGPAKDTDGDGLPDWWEITRGLNPNDPDSDGDGTSDFLEWIQGRNPQVSGTVPDAGGMINLSVYTPLK